MPPDAQSGVSISDAIRTDQFPPRRQGPKAAGTAAYCSGRACAGKRRGSVNPLRQSPLDGLVHKSAELRPRQLGEVLLLAAEFALALAKLGLLRTERGLALPERGLAFGQRGHLPRRRIRHQRAEPAMMNVPLVLVVLGLIAGIVMPKERMLLVAALVIALPTVGAALGTIPTIGAKLTAVAANLQLGAAAALASAIAIMCYELVMEGVTGLTTTGTTAKTATA